MLSLPLDQLRADFNAGRRPRVPRPPVNAALPCRARCARGDRIQVPEARLIAILRDPAERAFSSWMGHTLDGGSERRSFEQVVEDELPLTDP